MREESTHRSPVDLQIHLRGVNLRPEEKTLLDLPHLDLDFPVSSAPGSESLLNGVGVIGPNGSGKSSFLRLLNALTVPDAGSVTLSLGREEIDVLTHPSRARRVAAFVFSDPLSQLLLPTPVEDVMLSIREGSKRQKRSKALECLARLGIEHLAEESIYDLSSGERQRAALASILASEPQLLLLDEPTTLLDRKHVRLLQDLLLDLDLPFLMATHDLELAQKLPRVLYMSEGRLLADGPGHVVVQRYLSDVDSPQAPENPSGSML